MQTLWSIQWVKHFLSGILIRMSNFKSDKHFDSKISAGSYIAIELFISEQHVPGNCVWDQQL